MSTNSCNTQCAIKRIFASDDFSKPQKAFILICILLTLCAIAIFIWLIVDAAKDHSARGILFGSALVLGTIGLLVHAVLKPYDPRRAMIALWVSIPVAVAAAVVALFVQGGASQPNIDRQNAELRLEQHEAITGDEVPD